MQLYKAGLFFLSFTFCLNAGQEEDSSMFYQANHDKNYSVNTYEWLRCKAPDPLRALRAYSSWLSLSPKMLILQPNKDPLRFLGRQDLWQYLQDLGLQGLDLGPLQLSGEVIQGEFSPSAPQVFAPISNEIDPHFGTKEEIKNLAHTASLSQGTWISSLDTDNTGRGVDFFLALQNFKDYPTLYQMAEVAESDWQYLPSVPAGYFSAPLSLREIDTLKKQGYLPAELEPWNFFQHRRQETNIDATIPVVGKDGKKRRWVYLHSFHPMQPLLNPLHPSFSAERMLSGELFTSLSQGSKLVKFLTGISCFSSLPMLEQLAYLARSQGAFCLEGQALPLENMKMLSMHAIDLFYDHYLKEGLIQALFSGKAEPLRSRYRKIADYGLKPLMFVHTLQTQEGWKRETEPFSCQNARGVTTIEMLADVLAIKDLSSLCGEAKEKITRLHFMIAMLQAMQPGAFVLSMEDLVGAYPKSCCKEGSFAYDLFGENPDIAASRFGHLKGNMLYGSLLQQKKDPKSFASQLKLILKTRKNYQIFLANTLLIPETTSPSLFVLIHRLPSTDYLQLTAVNFSSEVIKEELEIEGIKNTSAINLFTRKTEAKDYSGTKLVLELNGHEGKAILFQPKFSKDYVH